MILYRASWLVFSALVPVGARRPPFTLGLPNPHYGRAAPLRTRTLGSSVAIPLPAFAPPMLSGAAPRARKIQRQFEADNAAPATVAALVEGLGAVEASVIRTLDFESSDVAFMQMEAARTRSPVLANGAPSLYALLDSLDYSAGLPDLRAEMLVGQWDLVFTDSPDDALLRDLTEDMREAMIGAKVSMTVQEHDMVTNAALSLPGNRKSYLSVSYELSSHWQHGPKPIITRRNKAQKDTYETWLVTYLSDELFVVRHTEDDDRLHGLLASNGISTQPRLPVSVFRRSKLVPIETPAPPKAVMLWRLGLLDVLTRDGKRVAGSRNTELTPERMTKNQLQDILRARGLRVSGKKAELVHRLQNELQSPASSAEAELRSLTVLQLKTRLRSAGLPVSGWKAELVQRLLDTVATTASVASQPPPPVEQRPLGDMVTEGEHKDAQLQRETQRSDRDKSLRELAEREAAAIFEAEKLEDNLAVPQAPWQVFADDTGTTYYHNPTTGMTQWEHPGGSAIAAASETAAPWRPEEPPTPWSLHLDPASDKWYYVNDQTQETSWNPPVAASMPAQAATPAKKSEAERLEPENSDVQRLEASKGQAVPGTEAQVPATVGRHVLVVLSGVMGSGKSSLSKLMGRVFKGSVWMNQDEFAHLKTKKETPRYLFTRALGAAMRSAVASGPESPPRLIFVDKMNHLEMHRTDVLQQVSRSRWRENGGLLLLVEMKLGEGADLEMRLDTLRSRIDHRGNAHKTLRPAEVKDLTSILAQTADCSNPISPDERLAFDGVLELDATWDVVDKAVYVSAELFRLGWVSALDWRRWDAPEAEQGPLPRPRLLPGAHLLPTGLADTGPCCDWQQLRIRFAAEWEDLQLKEELQRRA